MKNARWIMLLAAALSVASPSFAGHDCGQGQCSVSQGDCGKRGDDDCASQCPITAKFMKKAHFFLSNKDEIGLSEDQVKTIKALKADVQKLSIRQEAEMKIMFLDLESKLSEEKVDVAGIGAMLDQGSAGMTSGAKQVVEAYAKLKGALSADQMAKAKAIWASKK